MKLDEEKKDEENKNKEKISNPNNDNIKFLIKGLSDTNGLARRNYSEELSKVGRAALPELINTLLNSENVIQRRAAAKTIKLIEDPKALPDLIKALATDSDPVVQCSAAGAIAIFGEEAVNHLINVLENHAHTEMQYGLAAWCLAFIGANAPNAIKKAAKSKNPNVKCAAISALEEQIRQSHDEEAIQLVENAIDDSDKNVQIEAIKLVGKLQKIEFFIPTLISKLNNKNPDIRKASVLSLMQLNIKESLSQIKEMYKVEQEIKVRKVIELALKKIDK